MTSTRLTVLICSINGVSRGVKTAPVLPEEITSEILACIDAGAAIIHFHTDRVRVSGTESADRYLEAWRPIATRRPDALFYPTINWAPDGSLAYDHLKPLAESGYLRIGVNDLGSMATGELVDELPIGDAVYANSYNETAERIALCRSLGIGMATQILEPSGLRTVLRFWRAGLLPRGTFLNFYFYDDPKGPPPRSGFASLPPSAPALAAMLDMLGDCPLPWAASIWGGSFTDDAFLDLIVASGGHLNLGLETFGGDAKVNNVDILRRASELIARKGSRPATLSEAATMFDIPFNRLASAGTASQI